MNYSWLGTSLNQKYPVAETILRNPCERFVFVVVLDPSFDFISKLMENELPGRDLKLGQKIKKAKSKKI